MHLLCCMRFSFINPLKLDHRSSHSRRNITASKKGLTTSITSSATESEKALESASTLAHDQPAPPQMPALVSLPPPRPARSRARSQSAPPPATINLPLHLDGTPLRLPSVKRKPVPTLSILSLRQRARNDARKKSATEVPSADEQSHHDDTHTDVDASSDDVTVDEDKAATFSDVEEDAEASCMEKGSESEDEQWEDVPTDEGSDRACDMAHADKTDDARL